MHKTDFLTIYEFCNLLGVHYNTARKMIKQGRLSALKLGVGGKTSDYRIPISELQRLAEVNLGEIVDKIVESRIKSHNETKHKLFFDKVEKTDSCWMWKGAISSRGYGNFLFRNIQMRSNRVSFLIHNGEIPDGFLVCHTCDNPLCVNPDHLFLGTSKDNMHDMIKKGRSRYGEPGENHHSARLTDKEVESICEMRKKKIKAKVIATEFGISSAYVYQISKGIYRRNKTQEP